MIADDRADVILAQAFENEIEARSDYCRSESVATPTLTVGVANVRLSTFLHSGELLKESREPHPEKPDNDDSNKDHFDGHLRNSGSRLAVGSSDRQETVERDFSKASFSYSNVKPTIRIAPFARR
jgi:hypothetical protein